MNMSIRTIRVVAVVGLAFSAAVSHGAVIEVIHTGIPGHPTAQVPGSPAGVEFRGPIVAFLDLYGSPSGNHWIIKAFSNEADTINEVILVDDGMESAVVAKEGGVSPIGVLNYGFMDSDCAINDNGEFAFGNRLSAGTTTDEIIFKRNPMGALVSAVREGDAAPGLTDTGTIGDELFGNSLNSPVILNNNTVLFRADLIQNIATAFRSALYSGSMVLAQEGTALVGGTYDSFVASSLAADANGTNWMAEADIDPTAASTEAAILNGTIVLKDGDALLSSTVTDIFSVDLSGDGRAFIRGSLASGVDFITRDGVVIAASGQPIVGARGVLNWGDTLSGVAANSVGDYLVTGNTSSVDPNVDQAMVLNGADVVAEEGNAVDLNGNGMADDDAFITSFGAGDVVLADDGTITFVATIRNGAGTSLGNGLFRIAPPPPACPGDFDGSGDVGLGDIAFVINNWGPGFGLEQLAEVINNWELNCP